MRRGPVGAFQGCFVQGLEGVQQEKGSMPCLHPLSARCSPAVAVRSPSCTAGTEKTPLGKGKGRGHGGEGVGDWEGEEWGTETQ